MGIRFDGLATGFDTTAILDAILNVERQPLRQLERRRSGLQEERTLLQQFNTNLLSLRDAAKGVDNQISTLSAPSVDEELLAFVANSSDEAILTVSASQNATVGSTEITVNSLASVSRDISTAFSSSTDPIAASGETLSIDYGGDDSIEITVGAGGASLVDLKGLINTDVNNDGSVRAEILFDGVGHRLIVSGTTPGQSNDVTVSTTLQGETVPNPFFDPALAKDATDASLQVFGLDITRESNDVSDVIPGVTLQLVGDGGGTGATATVDVARDDDSIAEKITAVVDGYNAISDFLTSQAAFDEATGSAGPLSGDSTLRGIQSQLQRIVGGVYTFADNPFSNLAEIGVTFDRTGGLSLDTERLEESLATDASAVRELLSGDGTTDGAATALARALEPITQVGDGLLSNRERGIDDRIEALDVSIERFERRLEQREDALRLQFSRLESQVSTLQAQGTFLTNAFQTQR